MIKGEIPYELVEGVVLGQEFLNKDEFTKVFKNLLEDTDGYTNLRYNLALAKKIISITQSKKGMQTTVEYTDNLEAIAEEFSKFMGGLGGDISLLTTFNFQNKNAKSEIYFLAHEKDLPSQLNEIGAKTYLNTLESLQGAIKEGKEYLKLNQILVSHLNGFYSDLTTKDLINNPEQERYRKLIEWAKIHMNNRYKANLQRKKDQPISLSQYFWGRGQTRGYVAEAYGIHLALIHPNVLVGNHIANLKRSVINEHGGKDSVELFNLLNATKGNTSSQMSGDIVVLGSDGKVALNIQSKASKYSNYKFAITYKQFLNKMDLFLQTYDKYVDNIDKIKQSDIDKLFKAFSTQAWAPISKEISKGLKEEIEGLFK